MTLMMVPGCKVVRKDRAEPNHKTLRKMLKTIRHVVVRWSVGIGDNSCRRSNRRGFL